MLAGGNTTRSQETNSKTKSRSCKETDKQQDQKKRIGMYMIFHWHEQIIFHWYEQTHYISAFESKINLLHTLMQDIVCRQ